MTANAYSRRYPLLFGYSVVFRFEPVTSISGTWEPQLPCKVVKSRARRQLIDAYVAARSDFPGEVATMTGRKVLIADEESIEVIHPETRQ